MSPPSGFFRGCRALFNAAKSSASLSQKPTISASAGKSAAPAPAAAKEKRGAGSGLLKPTPVSPTLRAFLGVPEISRVEAIKKVWGYIKLHNLQNPNNKREIVCDGKLKAVFNGKDKVGFLEVAKLLSSHFVKN